MSMRTLGADAMPTYCTCGALSETNVTATLVDWSVGSVVCVPGIRIECKGPRRTI